MTAPVPVAFVLTSFAGGGAQKVLLTFAMQVDRAVFDPVIVVLNDSGPWRSLVPEDLRVISLSRSRLRDALPSMVRVLRAEKPAIVVSTIGYMNIGVLMVKPLLAGNPRVIVREANTPSRHAQGALGRLAYDLSYRWLYCLADLVLCPATFIKDELIADYGIPARKITVIPNPVDERAIRASIGAPRRMPGPGRRFVCIGRLTEQKGYDRLLDDFARLPLDSRLTIFGDGELQGRLQGQAERLGIAARVVFAGFDPVPGAWLAGADALLLPSRWEGLPNVVLEALSCGTPSIATPEAGGIAEIASHAPPGAVTIASPGDAFIAAMLARVPRPEVALGPSLLPDIYRLDRAAAVFSAMLAAQTPPSERV